MRHLQRHFQKAVASIAIGRVSNSADHEHSIVVDLSEILREIPRRAQDLILNKLCNLPPSMVSLFRTVLIRSVADFICFGYFLNAFDFEHLLSENGTFILADHLRSH